MKNTLSQYILCFCLTACNYNVSLKEENDFFSIPNGDEYYTQGLELGAKKEASDYEYKVGQRIYTPDNKYLTNLQEQDRPYAGYLYMGGTKFFRIDVNTTNLYSYELGLVGPSAGGEFAQNRIHRLLGNREAKGWGNQLKDEPIINLGFRQEIYGGTEWLPWLPLRTIVYWGYDLGNLLTASETGVRLERIKEWGSWQARLFSGLEGVLKAHDILLDGNTWKDSHSVEKENLVATALVGFEVDYQRYFLSYTYRLMTTEFREQPGQHSYGSVQFGKRFE